MNRCCSVSHGGRNFNQGRCGTEIEIKSREVDCVTKRWEREMVETASRTDFQTR